MPVFHVPEYVWKDVAIRKKKPLRYTYGTTFWFFFSVLLSIPTAYFIFKSAIAENARQFCVPQTDSFLRCFTRNGWPSLLCSLQKKKKCRKIVRFSVRKTDPERILNTFWHTGICFFRSPNLLICSSFLHLFLAISSGAYLKTSVFTTTPDVPSFRCFYLITELQFVNHWYIIFLPSPPEHPCARPPWKRRSASLSCQIPAAD